MRRVAGRFGNSRALDEVGLIGGRRVDRRGRRGLLAAAPCSEERATEQSSQSTHGELSNSLVSNAQKEVFFQGSPGETLGG